MAERLSKLGGTLTTASNQYNATVTSLVGSQGLYGRVERFGKLSEKVNKELPKLEISHRDFEHERMAMIVEAIQEPTAVEETRPYCPKRLRKPLTRAKEWVFSDFHPCFCGYNVATK